MNKIRILTFAIASVLLALLLLACGETETQSETKNLEVASNGLAVYEYRPDDEDSILYFDGKFIELQNDRNLFFGYVNKRGETVIPPMYVSASKFTDEGNAVVAALAGGYLEISLIDKDGEIVKRLPYDRITLFNSKGYALACIEGSGYPYAYGVIDGNGEFITGLKFKGSYDFEDSCWNANGLMVVEDIDTPLQGIINEIGEYIVEPKYTNLRECTNGYFCFKENGKYGCLDAKGEPIIAAQYDAALRFDADGYSEAQLYGKYGIINEKGETVLNFVYEAVSSYNVQEGFAIVRVGNNEAAVGFDGRVIADTAGANYGVYKTLICENYNGTVTYYNSSGEVIADIDAYLGTTEQSDSGVFRSDEKYGYKDQDGNIVIDPEYDRVFASQKEYIVACKREPSDYAYFAFDYKGKLIDKSNVLYSAAGLAIFSENGKYGVLDAAGNQILPAEYDEVKILDYENISVCLNGKYGLYNCGKEIVPVKYDSLAIGRSYTANNEIYRYILAKSLVDEKHEEMENQHVAWVGNYKPSLYDFDNGLLYEDCDSIKYFEEEKLFVIEKDGKEGVIDTQGNIVIDLVYDDIAVFEGSGYIRCLIDGKSGIIDTAGNVIFEPQFGYIAEFTENGLAVVKDIETEKYGYIHKDGYVAIPFEYDSASDFSDNGLARVSMREKVGYNSVLIDGYIDQAGRYVIRPSFWEASDFHDGLAAVQKSYGDLYGFINNGGNYVISPQYAEVRDFSNGIAAVRSDMGYWGYIDKTGAYVVTPQFGDAWDFNGEYAIASIGYDDYFVFADGSVIQK